MISRLAASTLALLMILATASVTGAQSIRVVSDVLVDATPTGAISEPHIAVDPGDPNHLLAAVMVTPPLGKPINDQHCATFSSADGGEHWTRHDFPIIECYDPWVVFLPDRTALFSSLGKDPILAGQGDGMLVYKSPDGGRTWNPRPAGLDWGWDHPMLVVDNSKSKRRGWVYLVSSRYLKRNGSYYVAVARSVDGGKTFDAPHNIAPDGQLIKAEPPAILSDGTLIVSYVELAEYGSLLQRRRGWVARSSNGIDFSKSTVVGDACAPPIPMLLSSFAVDASAGTFRDRLYFSCTLPAGRGVSVTHSTDGGVTWSAPVSATGDPRDASFSHALMATTVSSTGVLGVVWLQGRVGSTSGCRDVYMSASFDGGTKFTAPVRVSRAASCPNKKVNGPFSSFGDYFGLAADSRGRFRVAWSDARTGLLQLRTALVVVDGAAQ